MLGYVKLPNDAFSDEIQYVRKAPCLIIRTWEQVKELCELLDHGVVIARVITCDAEKLSRGKYSAHSFIAMHVALTLSEIPKSSRIFAKAAANATPECDSATCTMSSNIDMGFPCFSKWMVTTTYAL
jgi:hypothetical protein